MVRIFLKKWIFVFFITIASLVIGLKTSLAFFYFFFLFLLTTIIISLSWIFIEFFGIKLSLVRKIAGKVNEDDILKIETIITNNSFLPVFNLVFKEYLPYIFLEEKQKIISLEYLSGHSSFKLNYEFICSQRGRYKIGPSSIYFFDPFGLFFLKRTLFVFSEFYVYPKTFTIKKFPPLANGMLPWFGINSTRASGEEDEFFGVREYKEGDPIRKIHWLSTARKNSLIVKQFQNQSFFRATVIFNLEKDKNFGEGRERVAEYIIKIAASVAKYLIERGVSVEIIAHTGEIVHIPFNRGEGHLDEILKTLTFAQAESRVGLVEIFDEFSRYILNDTSLIIIMLDKDWEYLPAMVPLDKRNISLVPLIIMSPSFLYPSPKQKMIKDAEAKLFQAFNFFPLFFSRGDNLEEKFSSFFL